MNNPLETEIDSSEEHANILIVDDLPEKLLVFKTVLEDLGQNLVMVKSGADALREILVRDFAVILLDVNMPDIDGLETASLIRRYKRTAHTPIIFITSYADEMQTARGYSLGAVDYILSPVVPEVLRSKVSVFVQLYEMQRRTRFLAEERVAFVQATAARTAAEKTTRRSNFLSRASRELSTSLDLNTSMHRLVEMLVPTHAELAVLLVDMDDQAGVMLVRASEPGTGPVVTQILPPYSGLPAGVSEIMGQAVSEGSVIQMALETAPMDDVPRGLYPGQWRSDLKSLLAIPLRIGSHSLGVLALASIRTDEFADESDCATMEELAGRAAIAFENARLYRSLQVEIVRSRQAEEELHAASRLKDEFLAMLSHELRNPLAPIRNAVEVMRQVAPVENPSLIWALDVVDRQVTHLSRLMEDLLDVSRISQGKISLRNEAIELGQVIAHGIETARPLIEARGHRLTVEACPEPIHLHGDFARLAQVVSNLLNNAAKYTQEGGQIALTTKVEGDQATITVRDNGMGIDAGLLPRIFDLFAQGERSLDRSQGGLGIGLTLVQRIVEQHQGTVKAASAGAGMGAEITITLPCMTGAPVQQIKPAASPSLVRQSGCARVLVVDDNLDAAESVAMFLGLAGYETATAPDGLQAINLARNFSPNVIIIDIGLPGMSGYDVARQLRENHDPASMLLIALTGYGQKEDQLLAMQAGFDHHFIKPMNPDNLHKVISERFPPTAGVMSAMAS